MKKPLLCSLMELTHLSIPIFTNTIEIKLDIYNWQHYGVLRPIKLDIYISLCNLKNSQNTQ